MFILLYANCVVMYCVSFYVVVGNKLYLILNGSTFRQNKLVLAFHIILWRPVEDDRFVGVAGLDISCAAPFWTDGTKSLLEKGPNSRS